MGIIKEDTDILDPTQLGHCVGPAVHLYNHDASSQSWYGSVLIACHTNALGNKRASMTYSGGRWRSTGRAGRYHVPAGLWRTQLVSHAVRSHFFRLVCGVIN